MKHISLVLDGFLGFRLRHIDHFEYYPEQKTQVILGTNGSGKSSLIRELSPLPANQLNYVKGGNAKKEITIDHNGHIYVLKSTFGEEGPKYSFIMDGENLNPGHTVTVYRELVKEHFNYTAEVHALATGRTKFCTMSTADRRKLFTEINDTDFTYAIKYYARAKEKVTYLQNGLKMTQTRLVQETEKCLTEKGEYELRQKIAELSAVLNTLLEHRKPRHQDPNQYKEAITRWDTAIERDLQRLERFFSDPEGNHPHESRESLQSAAIEAQVRLNTAQREIADRCERLEQLNKDFDAVSRTGSENITDVQRAVKELNEELDDLLSHLSFKTIFDDPATALASFENIRPTLEDIYGKLTALPHLTYTLQSFDSYTKAGEQLDAKLSVLMKEEEKLFADRKLHEASFGKGDVVCPKCTHRWIPNYSEGHHKKIEKDHIDTLALIETIKAAKVVNDALLAEHRMFFDCINRYRELVRHFSALKPYWDYISVDQRLTTQPDALAAMLNRFSNDLRLQVKYVSIKNLLQEKQATLKLMESAKDLDRNKITEGINAETVLLHKAQLRARDAFNDQEENKTKLAVLKSIEDYHASLNHAVAQRDIAIKSLIEDCCISTLDEIIRSVRLTLSQYERTVSQIDIQKALVEDLKKQTVALEAELKLAKLVTKALSPSEGLIAKGMTGFINHFVKSVNAFIAEFWLYPLAIQPIACTEEDGVDLDYRFEVLVNDDLPVKDVSLCSAGMQEIINLAVANSSMYCRGLGHFPIFLDEFAAAMDPAHRQQAYQAIDRLIESSDYSQVFLVSHYQDGYSSLSAADVLVLCDNNVQLPQHLAYNQHVVLK